MTFSKLSNPLNIRLKMIFTRINKQHLGAMLNFIQIHQLIDSQQKTPKQTHQFIIRNQQLNLETSLKNFQKLYKILPRKNKNKIQFQSQIKIKILIFLTNWII